MYLASWGNRPRLQTGFVRDRAESTSLQPSSFYYIQIERIVPRRGTNQFKAATSYESARFIGDIGEHDTSKTFRTMLLPLYNPFLTRELRIMGFEGNSNEISLKRHADKTRTACRQDRVLGDVSWTRGKCQKHECRSEEADVHGFEPQARARRVAKMALVLLCRTAHARDLHAF